VTRINNLSIINFLNVQKMANTDDYNAKLAEIEAIPNEE